MDEPLFGRYEAAALLAVESANGGELAPLEQFLATYANAFGVLPEAGELTDSIELLVDASLVEWRDGEIGLTVKGRKMLRHVGPKWQHDRPERLTERLSLLSEGDLVQEGALPSPSERELTEAMAAGESWSVDEVLPAGLQPVREDPILGVGWTTLPIVPPQ